MIQVERKTPKEPKEKTLEEIILEQAVQIQDLKSVVDDIILNGGAI